MFVVLIARRGFECCLLCCGSENPAGVGNTNSQFSGLGVPEMLSAVVRRSHKSEIMLF